MSTISRIKRLIIRIKKLKTLNLSKSESQNEINNILRYTERILYELSDEKDRDLVLETLLQIDINKTINKGNFHKELQRLPKELLFNEIKKDILIENKIPNKNNDIPIQGIFVRKEEDEEFKKLFEKRGIVQ